jgi:hypothetical protein
MQIRAISELALLVLDPIHVGRTHEVCEALELRPVPRAGDPDAVVTLVEGEHWPVGIDSAAVVGDVTAGGVAENDLDALRIGGPDCKTKSEFSVVCQTNLARA